MRMKQNTVDIYSNKDMKSLIKNNNKGLIIFTEHEYGCASHLAISSIVDMSKPSARILSHLISNNVFNQTEEFENIGWEIYFRNEYTILNINQWPSTPLIPPEAAQGTWIYIYPVVRDLLEFFYDNGITDLYFLSSSTIHDALDNDVFKIYESSTVVEYEFDGKFPKRGDNNELFFNPPTWLFPYLANLIGYDKSVSVISGHNDDERVDKVAGVALMDWLESKLSIAGNVEELSDKATELTDAFERNSKLHEQIETVISGRDSPKNSMLWG